MYRKRIKVWFQEKEECVKLYKKFKKGASEEVTEGCLAYEDWSDYNAKMKDNRKWQYDLDVWYKWIDLKNQTQPLQNDLVRYTIVNKP